MPIPNYGLLKGTFVKGAVAIGGNPHYQLEVTFTGQDGTAKSYEVPINTKSQDYPSELLFLENTNFNYTALTSQLTALAPGLYYEKSVAGGIALDYIKEEPFSWHDMQPVDTDGLDDKIASITNGLPDDAVCYLFGQIHTDAHYNKALDFQPDGGIHDIHMNQGNSGKWSNDNGPYQDGGFLINIPSQNQWIGLFFAFQSQAHNLHVWDDTDQNLQAAAPTQQPVSVAAALVNPLDQAPQKISVLNSTDHDANVNGWTLTSGGQVLATLNGDIAPGHYYAAHLSGQALPADGGSIELVNAQGEQVHTVTYGDTASNKAGLYIKF